MEGRCFADPERCWGTKMDDRTGVPSPRVWKLINSSCPGAEGGWGRCDGASATPGPVVWHMLASGTGFQ